MTQKAQKRRHEKKQVLTSSHSIVLKNGCVMISIKPDSRLQPSRSAGFLFRNPLRMEAAFTLSERGMRIVFSRMTATKINIDYHSSQEHTAKYVTNEATIIATLVPYITLGRVINASYSIIKTLVCPCVHLFGNHN